MPRPGSASELQLSTAPPWASPTLSLGFPTHKMGQACGLCGHVTGMKPGKEVPGWATANPQPARHRLRLHNLRVPLLSGGPPLQGPLMAPGRHTQVAILSPSSLPQPWASLLSSPT